MLIYFLQATGKAFIFDLPELKIRRIQCVLLPQHREVLLQQSTPEPAPNQTPTHSFKFSGSKTCGKRMISPAPVTRPPLLPGPQEARRPRPVPRRPGSGQGRARPERQVPVPVPGPHARTAQRRGPYLLDVQLRVRLLAAQQLHGEAGLRQQHRVPVPAITRARQLATGPGDRSHQKSPRPPSPPRATGKAGKTPSAGHGRRPGPERAQPPTHGGQARASR